MTDTVSDDSLWIADTRVQPSSRLIQRGKETVRLEPRVMSVLVHLAKYPDEVVTRTELEDSVWPGMVIGYDTLSNTVVKLRKAFADNCRDPQVIETIPKVGYRLIAEVHQTPPTPSRRNTWRPYLQWAVAATVLVLVGAALYPRPASDSAPDPAARAAFLQGWEHYKQKSPGDFTNARVYLEKAVTMDPHYSAGYAALAALYLEAYRREWYPALRVDCMEIKQRALEYLAQAEQSPTSISHMVNAEIQLSARQHAAAMASATQALELSPEDVAVHYTLAKILIFTGFPERALERVAEAARLDPGNTSQSSYLRGLAAFNLGRFETATGFLSQALEANPANRDPALILAAAYGHLNRHTEASIALKQYQSEYHSGIDATVILRYPYKNDRNRTLLAEGLQRAGMARS